MTGNQQCIISGGSLSTFLVQGLPKITSQFDKWIIYFCDERVVPENDSESTFGLYKKALIENGIVNLKEHQFITLKQNVSGNF